MFTVHNLWHCFSGIKIKSITLEMHTIRDPNQQVLLLEVWVLKAVPDKSTTTPGDSPPCFIQQKWFLLSLTSHLACIEPLSPCSPYPLSSLEWAKGCLLGNSLKDQMVVGNSDGPKGVLDLKKVYLEELEERRSQREEEIPRMGIFLAPRSTQV